MSNRPNVISIGGFAADQDNPDDFRVTVKVEGWGAAPSRLGMEERQGQDGAHDSAGHRAARAISHEGFVDCASAAGAHAAADQLTALSPRELHEYVIDNEAVGARSCMVRIAVGADPEWIDDKSFTYGISLVAPDPVLYGEPMFAATGLEAASGGAGRVWPRVWPRDWGVAPGVTPGSMTLLNSGTATYWPRLRIDGPVTNPVVTLNETGDWIRYGGTISAGQWLDVDLSARRVLLNGLVSHAYKVTFSGAWLAVPPGGGSLSWTADGADPAASLSVWSYESAWN